MTRPQEQGRICYRAPLANPYPRWIVSCTCVQCRGAIYRDGTRHHFGPWRVSRNRTEKPR